MSRLLSWDDTYCPKGHGSWTFLPASILYSDIYWCPDCDLFYQPTVKSMTPERLNKEFASDHATQLKQRARFIKWKDNLSYKDMPDDCPEEAPNLPM